jgi:alpha-L-rhamnosidase
VAVREFDGDRLCSMANGSGVNVTLKSPSITALRAEHRRDALGIGTRRPRLSWRLQDSPLGWLQSAYEIEAQAAGLTSMSGRVESDESVLVPWPFDPLRSREQVTVRVRTYGADGTASMWSDELTIEAGLFDAAEWTGRFVTPTWSEDRSRPGPTAYLRRKFEVRHSVARARLYATALGVYELHLNGVVVGDDVLAPGWTSYHHRLRYQTFDVTAMLRPGSNALGAIVADGWYRGRLGFHGGRRNIYGERLGFLAQLEIQYTDGTTDVLGTDDTWQAATGPILEADLYDGETHDARLERDGWALPGHDDGDWTPVATLERDLTTLVAPAGPPVRRIELVEPVSATRSPSGVRILDFGQNLVGRLRIAAHGESGRTITLRHAEVLEKGELCVRPLRTAAATDRYVLRGGAETWEPRFTFHGFRYAEVSGWPGDVHPGAIRAVVCHTDLERTGWFECSDPLVNRLHENVVWSMRGNFLDLPTDCPQRDERLGWTGDIAVFAPTASFLYDCAGFLTSWLADLAADQHAAGGRVPSVVPDILPPPDPRAVHDWTAATAGWGDAAVAVPWTLYERFGDRQVLADQYESMRDWVDLVTSLAGTGRVWRDGFQFGDWLDPAAQPERPELGRTDNSLVATAHFARSARLLADTAAVLGRREDETRYRTLAAEVRAAFVDEYVRPDGTLSSDSPTGYALALEFGLLRDELQRGVAGRRLAELVEADGYRIGTGFLGTPLVCDALCSVGEHEAAYRLLLQTECPSWLYPVTLGATTVWERWDSLLPDGRVNTEWMTSFNHYAFGAVADWLHRTVAGLAPAEPGYRTLRIRPLPGGGLTHARARHITPYGEAATAWHIEDEVFHLEVTAPSGTDARVTLPGAQADISVQPGTHSWAVALPESFRLAG